MKLSQKRSVFERAISYLLLFSFVFSNVAATSLFAADEKTSNGTVVSKLTTDLTQLGLEGRLRESLNFESETRRVIEMLEKGEKRQPVIVDEKSESQDTIVEQVAIQMAKGLVLKNKRLLKLETAVLFSNAKSDEEVVGMADAVFKEAISSNGGCILFVDELTNFVGSEKFISAIATGKLKIVGGSSKAAYAEKIEASGELDSLFEAIETGNADTDNAGIFVTDKNEYRGDNVSSDLREMMDEDPSGNKRVDVIVQAKDADNSAFRALLASGTARIISRIGTDETLVVNMPLFTVQSLSLSGMINYISPDRPTATTGHIEDTTGLTMVRSQPASANRPAYTLDGTDIGIAVLDSGIYSQHNGFDRPGGSSRIIANLNFTNQSGTADTYGHGTHVAGLATGNSAISGGSYEGIASNANIISLKVLNNAGVGQTSWLLAGLDWIRLNRQSYNIRVVNLSLGTSAVDTYTNDPLCLKVKDLVREGIVVVAAAGNLGRSPDGQKTYGRIHSPGNSPYVITVGASNTLGTLNRNDDNVTSFSSRGPTRSYYRNSNNVKIYDNLIKPDIVAPGNRVISHKSPNSVIAVENGQLSVPGPSNEDGMMWMSGTSMSTPVVSGAVALLLQANPNLTPQMVKMLLQYSAQPIANADMFEQGAGQINIDGAVRLARSLRSDAAFEAAALNHSTIPSNWTAPAMSSTIGTWNFNFSQLITSGHSFITGQNLLTRFQDVFKRDKMFVDGVSLVNNSLVLNSHYTSGLTLYPHVVRSDGGPFGSGSVLMSAGALVGDGVLLGEGVVIGDGVVVGDAGMTPEILAMTDSIMVNGDNTPFME